MIDFIIGLLIGILIMCFIMMLCLGSSFEKRFTEIWQDMPDMPDIPFIKKEQNNDKG